MTPELRAELREWYRMATDRGDSPRSRSQAQAELWNRLTCEGWQRPEASIRAGEGLLPALLDAADRAADYDARLSAVMPKDFKDWWQNAKAEWPEVAAGVIVSLRKREEWALAQFSAEHERHAITARKIAEAEKLRDAAVAQWERIEGEFHGLRQELKAAKAECEALRLQVLNYEKSIDRRSDA